MDVPTILCQRQNRPNASISQSGAGCRTVADERSAAVENRQRLSPGRPARSVDHDIDAPAGGCEDERRPARIAVVEAGLGTEGRRVVELHSIRGGDKDSCAQLAADLKGVRRRHPRSRSQEPHGPPRHRRTSPQHERQEASEIQCRCLLERESLGLRYTFRAGTTTCSASVPSRGPPRMSTSPGGSCDPRSQFRLADDYGSPAARPAIPAPTRSTTTPRRIPG